jgi:hypothetical protein
MSESFESCLADYSPILVELAAIIGANYVVGTFENAEEEFISSNKSSENWFLIGNSGRLIVTFEQYEGYYFSEFIAAGSSFQKGKELIRSTYLAQGGNPEVP